ncbi:hypothetical protein R1flu_023175 [Riccia fluitans]|uniref:Uncharacterized protein n=1 Tax=Riccia fluitans TaxID=41844 RepID=A0ABD1XRA3_9MARC
MLKRTNTCRLNALVYKSLSSRAPITKLLILTGEETKVGRCLEIRLGQSSMSFYVSRKGYISLEGEDAKGPLQRGTWNVIAAALDQLGQFAPN